MAKIMIVDDAVFMRSVIKGILESGGWTDTCEADDGDTAVEMYASERPDLTILDITMPRQDGIETLRQIKNINPAAKVIMCSAIGQEKQIIKAVRDGAADYIVKPFKPENMLKVVKSALG